MLLAVLLMRIHENNDRLQREVDRLLRDANRPDDELVTRWDVVTIVIALVGGLVTAVAAVLGIAQWVTG